MLTIVVVHVSYFSPHFSVFAPLHVYPVAADLPPPCWNRLLFSAKVIIYLFLLFIPPSKISVQRELSYYGNLPPTGCQISHLHVFARHAWVCVCVSVYPLYCVFPVERPFITLLPCCLHAHCQRPVLAVSIRQTPETSVFFSILEER